MNWKLGGKSTGASKYILTYEAQNLHQLKFLKILWSGISIDADFGPFKKGMYFDAVVVFVTKFSLLFRLALAIT